MKEMRKTNSKRKAPRKIRKVAKKKIIHLQKVAERKAALAEKIPEQNTEQNKKGQQKKLGLSPSAGSIAAMKKLSKEEYCPDAYSTAISKNVDLSRLPNPNDREAIRKRYRELTGGPALI